MPSPGGPACCESGAAFPTPDIPSDGDKPDLFRALARTIEFEIVPRLVMNTRQRIGAGAPVPFVAPDRTSHSVSSFCQIILTREMEETEAYVGGRIAAGADRSGLLVDLLAPAARRLGELWESDECSFVDVTIALHTLQQLLRRLGDSYPCAPGPETPDRRALLTTVPDNQHLLGLLIVEELFRQSGWTVLALPRPSRSELLDAIARDWFAVVGLSISCDSSAGAVASMITEIRAASLNRAVLVLIGGRYVAANPEQARLLGADLAVADALDAIARSQELLHLHDDSLVSASQASWRQKTEGRARCRAP